MEFVVDDETVIRFFENPRRYSISLPLLVLSTKDRLGGCVGDSVEALLEGLALRETAYSADFRGQGGPAC